MAYGHKVGYKKYSTGMAENELFHNHNSHKAFMNLTVMCFLAVPDDKRILVGQM